MAAKAANTRIADTLEELAANDNLENIATNLAHISDSLDTIARALDRVSWALDRK